MIDVDNSETAAQVIAWLNNHGVTTVTALLQGSSTYNPYGDGYIPYNVFLDPQYIVRYTDSGYSAGTYQIWAGLVEEYGYDPTFPYFENLSWEITDDGNGDGHPDPGENCQITFTLGNHECCADAYNVTGELYNDDPDIDITMSYCSFGDIPCGGTATSTAVEFSVTVGAEPHQTDFTFTVDADNAADPFNFEFGFGLGRAHWLVVDDDGGEDHAEWVGNSFDELGLYVDVWDGSQPVTAGELSNYDAVVWATGTSQNTLDGDEQAAATEYLQIGGRLLLSSQYLGEDIGGTPFFSNVLHAQHTTDNILHSWVVGIDGTPIAEGMEFLLAGSADGAANSVSPSAMMPIEPAQAFLEYTDQGEYAGVLYSNRDSKVIYLGFPIEAIGGLAGTNTRTEFLEAALIWLGAFNYDTIHISIQENYFELISFPLSPDNLDAATVFSTLEELVIVYAEDGGIYLPPNINTIGQIDPTDGYYVFSASDDILIVTGTPLSIQTSYTLQAGPWNWLGYPFLVGLPIEETLADIQSSIVIVQTDDGRLWIPTLELNTIGNMVPGEGYMVIVDEDLNFNFNYPVRTEHGGEVTVELKPIEVSSELSHFNPVIPTGHPYTLVIDKVPYEYTHLREGDEVAVFDGELCVGTAVYRGEQFAITAWQGEPTRNMAGFVPNGIIHFRSWSHERGESELAVEFLLGDGTFGYHPYSQVMIQDELQQSVAHETIPLASQIVGTYPNPFNPATTIEISLEHPTDIVLSVYNLQGQEVALLAQEKFAAGHHSIEWMPAVDCPAGIYFLQLKAGHVRQIRKLIYVK